MKGKELRFLLSDLLYLACSVLPLLFGILLKLLTAPPTDGIVITGARIYATLPLPIQPLPITEAQVNSALVILSVTGICLYLTHGIRAGRTTRRQAVAEWAVDLTQRTVRQTMGTGFDHFPPFIAAILALSAFSSLLSLLGLYPPTADLNTAGGWAILVFFLITYYKCKCGVLHYVRSFGKPVRLLAPMNVISEISTPFSMAFRHYGNILSGSIVSVLLAAALQGASAKLLGNLPTPWGEIPLLRVGLPALLSVYFDLFSACLQAYIFAVLTMLYISGGFPREDYEKRRKARNARKNPLR
ncbi:MAG: F0F1 ATP synthase subunit A [Clostridia bacterium]|nr:F0F1 ATP synthase subunit A [Clostridia bacterium]